MKKFSKRIVLLLLLFSMIWSFTVHAESQAKIVQVNSTDQEIKIFVKGLEEINEFNYQVGNTGCDAILNSILEEDIPMQTLILIDNSMSIPENMREVIKQLARDIVANRTEKEQFQVATFGEQLESLTDFTSDYSTLKKAIDEIQSQDRDTYLTDVLYDILVQFEQENNTVLRRIVIISDGVDNKSIGITKDEVNSKLKENPYLVYTVGCNTVNNGTELESMFAFSRISNAESFILNQENSMEIVDTLSLDRGIIVVNPNLEQLPQDGSIQNSRLSFQTPSGDVNLETKIHLSFGKVYETEEKVETSDLDQTTETDDSTDTKTDSKNLILYIVIGSIVVILLGVVFFSSTKKKTKHSEQFSKANDDEKTYFSENTLLHDEKNELMDDEYEKTELMDTTLFLDSAVEKTEIVLADRKDKTKVFTVSVEDSVVIGRNASLSNLVISYDKSVSSKHCEITVRDGSVFISDLNSSNGSFLNGVRLNAGVEEELTSHSILRLGRLEFDIEINR